MDYVESLRYAESLVKRAEEDLVAGAENLAEVLLAGLQDGPLAPDAELARERMLKLDESKYIKWGRWATSPEFSVPFWKDEGYPGYDSRIRKVINADWYSKRTDTSTFVDRVASSRQLNVPTVNGARDGRPTPIGQPANRWLLDFVALSSLRLSFKKRWEQLVTDIVRGRPRTDLRLLSETLCLTAADVLDICRKIRDYDDKVIGHSIDDPSMNMTYLCRKPNLTLKPLVDLP
ncbi:MAG: hypothetical protein HXY34_09875 [Candidatus Thorarchaeota archaeon]|nr:hypothetical protein [Candidatus Thorarchaeota archaeon]